MIEVSSACGFLRKFQLGKALTATPQTDPNHHKDGKWSVVHCDGSVHFSHPAAPEREEPPHREMIYDSSLKDPVIKYWLSSSFLQF